MRELIILRLNVFIDSLLFQPFLGPPLVKGLKRCRTPHSKDDFIRFVTVTTTDVLSINEYFLRFRHRCAFRHI